MCWGRRIRLRRYTATQGHGASDRNDSAASYAASLRGGLPFVRLASRIELASAPGLSVGLTALFVA